jgi:hypothetical protein
MSINTFFDHIYCINLDRRPDRWEKCLQEFEKHGIENVERFSAVDGNTLEVSSHLLKGEIGIIESHKRILNDAKNNNYNNILILEDDVEFHSNFTELFSSIQYEIPLDFDMIYIGGNLELWSPVQITQHVFKANSALALHAVGISASVYDIILSLIDHTVQIDILYAHISNRINSYIIRPRLAFQKADWSDIQNINVNYTFLRD